MTAINSLGESVTSAESIAVLMPVADVEPDAPTTLTRNDASTTKTQVAFTWSAPVIDGGDTVIDYKIEMDDDNDGVYSTVATGVTSTAHTETGLLAGSSYKFRVSARNSVGYSTPSSVLTIVAATVPSQPSAPTATLNGETSFTINWSPPTDLGGQTISGYRLEVQTSISTF